jgi:hypothetical protein
MRLGEVSSRHGETRQFMGLLVLVPKCRLRFLRELRLLPSPHASIPRYKFRFIQRHPPSRPSNAAAKKRFLGFDLRIEKLAPYAIVTLSKLETFGPFCSILPFFFTYFSRNFLPTAAKKEYELQRINLRFNAKYTVDGVSILTEAGNSLST